MPPKTKFANAAAKNSAIKGFLGFGYVRSMANHFKPMGCVFREGVNGIRADYQRLNQEDQFKAILTSWFWLGLASGLYMVYEKEKFVRRYDAIPQNERKHDRDYDGRQGWYRSYTTDDFISEKEESLLGIMSMGMVMPILAPIYYRTHTVPARKDYYLQRQAPKPKQSSVHKRYEPYD